MAGSRVACDRPRAADQPSVGTGALARRTWSTVKKRKQQGYCDLVLCSWFVWWIFFVGLLGWFVVKVLECFVAGAGLVVRVRLTEEV